MDLFFAACLGFVLPMVFTILLTPLIISFCHRYGVLDKPGGRKVHARPIPRLGGFAICVSFFASIGLIKIVQPYFGISIPGLPENWQPITIAAMLVFGIGMADDFHPIGPAGKFMGELVAATLVYFAGVRVEEVTNLFRPGVIDLGVFSYPVTILWLVGVTNAFNLIDGLDGLASGVALITSLTIFSLSLFSHEFMVGIFALALAGAAVGFLRFNFRPASIFLGDCGSLFLGFMLAVLSIQSSAKNSTAVAVFVPILSVGLPVLDTGLAILRRLLQSLLSPKPQSLWEELRRVTMPDKSHIHHKLISQGLSHRGVVVVLYLISCLFGVAAVALQLGDGRTKMIILGTVACAAIAGIRKLQYSEIAILRNGLLLGLYKRLLTKRNGVQLLVDLSLAMLACAASFLISVGGEFSISDALFLLVVLLVSLGQIGIMWANGLYRESLRLMGVGDMLKIVRITGICVIVSGMLMTFTPLMTFRPVLSTWLIDFYLLLSFVIGVRITFHVLDYIFRRNFQGGNRVVIYGAGTNGYLTLQKILHDPVPTMVPVGFLDDSPDLRGQFINGYPVFGGFWKLGEIIQKRNITTILIAQTKVEQKALDHIIRVSNENNVDIHWTEVRIEPFHAGRFMNRDRRLYPASQSLATGNKWEPPR